MRIEGDIKPALDALMEIQWQFRRGILQKALNVATRPVIKAAKQNARKIPKDSGTLAKAVQSRSRKGRKDMRRAWVGIGATSELVDVEQTGWRGKKYRRKARASKYAHLKEHGGHFGRFTKKSKVRGYPLFADALKGREAKLGADFTAEIEKGVQKAFAKGQAKSRALAKKLLSIAPAVRKSLGPPP